MGVSPSPISRRGARAASPQAGWRPTPPALADRLCERLPGAPTAVLDPACGEGALLLAALRRAGNDPHFARQRVFGLELDPERAETARRRLRAAAGLAPGSELDAHIRVGDGLSAEWPAGTWILANPPWISYSGRQARPRPGAPPADATRGLVERGSAGGWPSSHADFLLRIARHVGEQATGALVLLPASLLDLERYAPCRRAVLQWAHPREPAEELGERAFPGVIEPSALLELAPGSPARAAVPWSRARPAWLEALSAFPRLPPHSFSDPGVHSGNSAAQLVLPPDALAWPGLRQGRDLAAYHLGPPSARLFTELERGPLRRFRYGSLERYRALPILLRQTASRPIAAEHERPTYFRNSLLACRPAETLAIAAVVAILNGPVACAFHRASQRDGRQRAFPQVKVSALQQLPFPFLERAHDPRTHDRLAAQAAALARGEGGERARERLERWTLEAYGLPDSVRAEIAALAAC